MTSSGANRARKRTIADRDAPDTQWTSVVLDEGVLPTIKSAVDECSFTAPFDEFGRPVTDMEACDLAVSHQLRFLGRGSLSTKAEVFDDDLLRHAKTFHETGIERLVGNRVERLVGKGRNGETTEKC
jgi:hypothetical protein